jgi:hypothetical protein
MSLSHAIYDILHADTTIHGVFTHRIFPGVARADTILPCIVFDITNITPDANATSDYNWDRVNVSVTVIADKYSNCETYATNVRTALNRYSGTQDSEVINSIIYEGESSGYDENFTVSNATQGVAVFTRTCNFILIRTS